MISRLKRKVIVLTAISLFALLVLIVSGMNIISFVSLTNESDDILAVISENDGRFPEGKIFPSFEQNGEQMPKNMPRRFSEELQFETRYFSVVLNLDGTVVRTDTGRIAAVDTENANNYALSVLKSGRDRGFSDNYRYLKVQSGENYLITFLDCTRKLDSMRTFLLSSVIVSFCGFAVVFLILLIISGKIISPIAEAYEKQKRFITDASHELKTPLAIINANLDLIEDDVSDKESIDDMRNQIDRLRDLTEDLIILSRMEEGSTIIEKTDFDASKSVREILSGFNALSDTKGIKLNAEIQDEIYINADKKAFCKLVSIILDNAVKYTPRGGLIEFSLKGQGKTVLLESKNTTGNEMTDENTAHIFDRFYRTDFSRNSDTGGHGIGLSIAKAITEAHSGKISAAVLDTHTFSITAVLPI